MLVKFMPKGRAGIAYNSGKGRTHDPREPKCLAGDPGKTQTIIDSLDFANPETSVVLTYDREITDQEATQDIASFEEMLLPGMTPGLDYERVWHRHREYPKDPVTRQPDTSKPPRTGLHGNFANLHQPTGKRLQPYFDRTDRKRVEAWQELTNDARGYGSPKDDSRRRAVVLNINQLPRSVADLKATLTEAIIANVNAEQISTREELCAWLEQQGFKVERATKASISVSHPTLKKNLRLKGALYEPGGLEDAARARDAGEEPERRVREIGSDQRRRDLEEGLQRKRLELAERYPDRSAKNPGGLGVGSQEDPGSLRENDRGGAQEIGRLSAQDLDHGRGLSAPGHSPDSGRDPVPNMVHRLEGDNPSIGQPATERGAGPGRNQDAANPGQERVSSLGSSDRGAGKAPGSRESQTRQIDDVRGGQGTDDFRSGGPGRQDTGISGQHDHSSHHEAPNPLTHDTTEPIPDGGAFARFLVGLLNRARETAERARNALAAASRAIADRFFLGPQRVRELKETAQPGIDTALHIGRTVDQVGARLERAFQASVGNEQGQQRNGPSLWQGSRGFQLDEERVQKLSLGGNSVKRLGQMIGHRIGPYISHRSVNREYPGLER